MRSTFVALAAALSVAPATAEVKFPTGPFQGFNYGSTKSDKSTMTKDDFHNKFTLAQSLTPDGAFSSARLYTMIQDGTVSSATSAIQAAIDTNTTLLLGLWASGGNMANEVQALNNSISQYGDKLKKLTVGISVGNEDLYRLTPDGVASNAGPGVDAATLSGYIDGVKAVVDAFGWGDVPLGHVDTWTSYDNASNSDLWANPNVNFLGTDAYPYYQYQDSNSIGNAEDLYNAAIATTEANVKSRGHAPEVWLTEAGWPVSGPTVNLAVPSVSNAQTFWQKVGCPNFGKRNIWWFSLQLQDFQPAAGTLDFSIVGPNSKTPYFDLTCKATSSSSSSSVSTATSSSVSQSSVTAIVGGSDSKSGSSSIVDDSSSSASSTKSSSGSSASVVKGSSGSSVWSTYSSATGIVATASGSATIIPPGANTTVVSATLSTAQATTPLSTPTSASASTSPSSTGVSTSGAERTDCPALSWAPSVPLLLLWSSCKRVFRSLHGRGAFRGHIAGIHAT